MDNRFTCKGRLAEQVPAPGICCSPARGSAAGQWQRPIGPLLRCGSIRRPRQADALLAPAGVFRGDNGVTFRCRHGLQAVPLSAPAPTSQNRGPWLGIPSVGTVDRPGAAAPLPGNDWCGRSGREDQPLAETGRWGGPPERSVHRPPHLSGAGLTGDVPPVARRHLASADHPRPGSGRPSCQGSVAGLPLRWLRFRSPDPDDRPVRTRFRGRDKPQTDCTAMDLLR